MSKSVNNVRLHRFAIATALATLALIGIGGLVTSHEAGMAVPDWPTTYGQNMFLFPISQWRGGVFYEHTHRLAATMVGLMTAVLACWLWMKESRNWLRWLGVAAFVLVVLQGVLGGLRVVLLKDQIGIFHAALAQSLLVLLCAIALFTNSGWQTLSARIKPVTDHKGLRHLLLATTFLVFAQLLLGATMRHQHAGLAIPDFPLAYHKVWPAMDAASVASYNEHRLQVQETNSITAFQIGLQMAHRITALLIGCAVAYCAWTTRRELGARHPVARFSALWLGLICGQILLGAATIWTGKAPDIATLHVLLGALSLVNGALLTIVSFRVLLPIRSSVRAVAELAHSPFTPGNPAPSGAK